MLCPNCSHENSAVNKFCLNCGTELKVPASPVNPTSSADFFGMAKIKITCRPYKPKWFRIMYFFCPWNWKYKFYIDIDGKEYEMVSTEKEKEFRVPAGVHNLRIGYMQKNRTSKIIAAAGDIVQAGAYIYGSADAAMLGRAMSSNRVDISDYFRMNLEPGKTYEFKLKMNNLLLVREDV